MAPRLAVWTSRYSNKALARSGLVCVGITRWRPRFKLTYELKMNLTILAPSASMLAQGRAGHISSRQFKARYLAQLDSVGVDRIRAALQQLQGKARGIALLCYEDVRAGERCHRRYLADWLKSRAGLEIPELPESESLARPRCAPQRPRQLDLYAGDL